MSRPWRLPALIMLPVLLVAGLVVQAGDDAPGSDAVRLGELTPTAAAADTLSSTWYCAAGTATGVTEGNGAGAAEHQVILANASDVATSARVTVFPTEGEIATKDVEVGAHSRLAVALYPEILPAPAAWASALVEATGGEITVAHQLRGPNGRSVSDCASSPSANWYFAGGTTLPGADLWLVLFNPFPGDATVDVAFDTDEGARTPTSYAGILVPSRGVKAFKVSDQITDRKDIATTVSVRSGRIAAEMVQSDNGRADQNLPKGLTATIGSTEASPTWMFPTSAPVGVEVTEKVWVFNPGDADTNVRVQVQLQDPATNFTVEPFEFSVPAHHYAAIDVVDPAGAEPVDPASSSERDDRVPAGVPHWLIVQSTDGADIVAQRMLTGVDGQGLSYSMGLPVVATRWLLPVAGVAELEASLVTVANPSATETATVTLRRHAGTAADVPSPEPITIAPGDQEVLDLGKAGLTVAGAMGEIVSDVPVVVGQWLSFSSTPRDIATPVAIPVAGTQSLPLDLIGPTVAIAEDLPQLPDVDDPSSSVPDPTSTTVAADVAPTTTTTAAGPTTTIAPGPTTTAATATTTTAAGAAPRT